MTKIILAFGLLFLLTACPSEKEIQQMTDDLKKERSTAISLINAQDYSLDSLLKIQDYFFNFGEKVHLMSADPESQTNIKRMIKKLGARSTCEAFVVPTKIWEVLNRFCGADEIYRCSPEIKEYKNILVKFKKLSGEYKNSLDSESACN